MNTRGFWKRILPIIILAIYIFNPNVFAESIKSRMKERLPHIEALKAEGIIGENNKGYLELLGGKMKGKDIIQAENEDRKKVYTKIAERQGSTVYIVGKRRAKQIAENADPGEWIQKENGEWHQKK